MTIQVLLIGVLIAMGLFAALGWSVAQALRLRGRGQVAHLAHAGMIVLGMALISLEWPQLAGAAGPVLIAAALWAVWVEAGWSRLLPLIGAAFGVALMLGLPFAGG